MRLVRGIVVALVLVSLSACGDEGDTRTPGEEDLGMSFLSPAGGQTDSSSGPNYTIEVAITGASSDATYSLVYKENNCDGIDDNDIASDIAASDTTTVWDISGLANGMYCVFGTLSDGKNTVTANSGLLEKV